MDSKYSNPRRGLAHAIGLTLAAAAFSLPVTAFGNVVPIDTFATDQAKLVDTTPANGGLWSSVGDGTDTSILGGARDIFVELLSQSPSNPVATASAGVESGALVFNVDSLATGTATVQWDGPDNSISLNPTGLGGIDLTQGGTATEFMVNTLFSDQGYEFAVTAWTDANNWTRVTLLASGVSTPTQTTIPFAAFSICDGSADGVGQVVSIECAGGGSNPVDFSNLGALQLVLDPNGGTVSVDLVLDSITTEGDEQEPLACRVTGGGVDSFNQWDGTTYETGEMNHNGVGKLPPGVDRYTFGGQAGANTALQPQPKGEWTHHQQTGPSGSFSFHAGTASAAAGTEIDKITCMDPGFCNPARPAPAKQIDFEGIGNFHNLGKGKNAPVFRIPATVSTGSGNRGYNGTYHWFEVNIDDLGEPGVADKSHVPVCPPTGFGVKGAVELADCACPDFYRITIYNGVYANPDGSITPNKTDVIYEVYGYIDGGNLQIHPLTGFDRK